MIESSRGLLRALDEAIGQIHFDVGHDHKDTIILSGSARGGTTWIGEVINYDNSYRMIFEALSHHRDASGKIFLWGRYIRADDDNPAFVEPVRKIVSGRFRHGYSDRFNRKIFPRRRLMKEIGANLLLHWLHRHFPEIPLILLLRHPCGVVSSRLANGWAVRANAVSGFLRQEALIADFLSPFKADMEKATPFEAQFMHWCVETLVPLKQFKPGDVHLAFYENFCVDPQSEVSRMFAFLGKPVDERVVAMMTRPSKQTRLRKSLGSAPRFDSWRGRFTEQELTTAWDVLRRFGLDTLYAQDGMPNEQAALRLLES